MCDVDTQLSSFSKGWAFSTPLGEPGESHCSVAEQAPREVVPAGIHAEDAAAAALLIFAQLWVPGQG